MSEQKEVKILETLEKEIQDADIPEQEKKRLLQNCLFLREQNINLMITGATGCGKSSTINALFSEEVAKVGVGVTPETMDIQEFKLNHLILWDSPGLGDGVEADKRHARHIIEKLHEKDENGDPLIDLVLVILDGTTKDLGTSYELINKVIIPHLGEYPEKRLLVAINKCDSAMGGRHWNEEDCTPDEKLTAFLNEKVGYVKRSIKEGTNVDVDPIYYRAGFKEEGEPQEPSYNLSKLLYYILQHTPKEKRLVYVEHINQDQTVWESNDDLHNYQQGILETIGETISDCATKGADIGRDIGSVFGETGEAIGTAIGGVCGTAVGVVKSVWDIITGGSSSGGGSSGGGGCYITTAVCEDQGKPDDCYELTMFRSFRDNWLRYQPDGKVLIQRYYDTAPAIVEKINHNPNRANIYRHLKDTYLTPCLRDIEIGDNETCKARYTAMMEYLFEEQHRWEE